MYEHLHAYTAYQGWLRTERPITENEPGDVALTRIERSAARLNPTRRDPTIFAQPTE